MSDGKVFVIALVSAVLGGFIVAALMGVEVKKMVQSMNSVFSSNSNGLSPLISGFNRPLDKDV